MKGTEQKLTQWGGKLGQSEGGGGRAEQRNVQVSEEGEEFLCGGHDWYGTFAKFGGRGIVPREQGKEGCKWFRVKGGAESKENSPNQRKGERGGVKSAGGLASSNLKRACRLGTWCRTVQERGSVVKHPS